MRHAVALLCATACIGPTERNNPLDRNSDVDLQIVGLPDTIRSLLEVVTVTLQSDAPLPTGAEVTWSSNRLAQLSPGTFTPFSASFAPIQATLRATLGPTRNPRIVEREFVIRQRPTSVALDCAPACLVPSYTQDVTIQPTLRDSLGSIVTGYSRFNAPVEYEVRDTTVIRILGPIDLANLLVRSRVNGASWVVFRAGSGLSIVDSVLVTVQQVATVPTVACPISMAAGETRMITVTQWRDGRLQPFEGVPPNLLWNPGHPNDPSNPQGVSATVTPDGQVTAHTGGVWYTTASISGRGSQIVATCQIFIAG